MTHLSRIKGVIFDYGGTIDSNGVHWAEVIWQGYEYHSIPVAKEDFRNAYVHGERALARQLIILPHHTFGDMLQIKIRIQMQWLHENNCFTQPCVIEDAAGAVAGWCNSYALRAIDNARSILQTLVKKFPTVLVSNFYGNIESVLKDYRLDNLFHSIVESAVVGVRKPDPAIFALGLKELNLPAEEVVVIGDSYGKDIVPSASLGCRTIWLKSVGWEADKGNETADVVIRDFRELIDVFGL